MSVAVLDIAALAVLGLAGLIAFSLGFARVVLGLGSWIGAALLTIYGFPHLRPLAREWISSAFLADAAAGLALFIAALVVLSLISHAIARRVRQSGLGALDRSLGFVAGLGLGAVLLCVVFLGYAALTGLPPADEDRPQWLREARATPLIEWGADELVALVPREWGGGRAAPRPVGAGEDGDDPFRRLLAPERRDGLPDRQPGYNIQERREMDRLIQSQQ